MMASIGPRSPNATDIAHARRPGAAPRSMNLARNTPAFWANEMRQHIQDWADALGGIAIAALPFWDRTLEQIHLLAGTVATLCGAFIALHGVWRIVKRWRA